ncbi:UDP-glucuronosyltransferase 1-2-like [Haliotis rufescens]|uniref:UDP-glucuronosyltransferase 1-2-like n=1 Tax=Haliotis rufescens TaxID=6454 RepID=UPI00201E949F|nr:UDP-glucuronosyltransferase 1-2-like [Haliotis rufescens]
MDITLLCLLLAVQLCSLSTCNGAKILYLPFPLYSHVKLGQWLTDDLHKYGHELWTAYPKYLKSLGVLQDKKYNLIQLEKLGDEDVGETLRKVNEKSLTNKTILEKFLHTVESIIQPVHEQLREINFKIMKDDEFLQVVKRQHFDLVLVGGTMRGMELHLIPYHLGIPFCFLSTDIDPWRSGLPVNPSHTPITGSEFTDRMDFFQRVQNTLMYMSLIFDKDLFFGDDRDNFKGPDGNAVTPGSVMSEAKLWLIQHDVLLDYPRPSMPNVKYIGDLSLRKAQPLARQFKQFYNRSTNGVVVVSFGSFVNLEQPLVQKLFTGLLKTPYSYVIRLNVTSPDKHKFLTSSWIPQNDLLANPQTKLFITNIDASDQNEAVANGVPMVGIQIHTDQYYNANRLQRKGYGIFVDFLEITPEEIADKIKYVIETPSYKGNVSRAANILNDRPWTPGQEAAYWIDHVIKYGDAHFRSEGMKLPWYKFLCLDVFIFVSLIIVLLLKGVMLLVRLSLPGFFRKKQVVKPKKE